jgi:hypothetical protein
MSKKERNEMKELKEAARALMREEYERAAEKFGDSFHSPHEAYAVILEEAEEADFDIDGFNAAMDQFWMYVKWNEAEYRNDALKNIEKHALNAACECIQVAAMAYKARR